MAFFSGFKGPNPFELKDFGRIGFSRPAPPAPPPQLFFYSSADFADDFRLLSLANATRPVAVPPSLLHHPGSVDNSSVDNLSSPFFPAPSATRVLLGFYHGAAKIASRVLATVLVAALHVSRAMSWILATVLVAALQVLTASFWILATVLVAALQALASSEPLAIAAHALRERNSRDRLDLEVGIAETLASFWKVSSWADYQHGILTILRAKLKRSEEDRGSMAAALRGLDEDNSVLVRQAAEYEDKILALTSAATERYDKAQQAALERIQALEAQQREGQEALKAARQHIDGLQSTISNQAQRLQAGPGSFQHHPPPPSFPPQPHAPMGMRAPPPPSFLSPFPPPFPPASYPPPPSPSPAAPPPPPPTATTTDTTPSGAAGFRHLPDPILKRFGEPTLLQSRKRARRIRSRGSWGSLGTVREPSCWTWRFAFDLFAF
ncbi:hypothetical protein MMC07_000600 [Pseudocyphellaria aurata]|nr:hypothetical protein [Pseudocyphellaria aurata]